ncbi:MAG: 5-(carboxyamino)imidazole ribonucleotide mutase [Oligoflexia bacterium]|nr:5-(carboxyamino)imidazole ribonucleotide mutase [Oligoflexia bacterium]
MSKKSSSVRAAPVAIVMGSQSDMSVMTAAGDALKKLGIASHTAIISAHRTPHEVAKFAEGARKKGIQVIIAGAGGAAHLPGMIAAYTELPVIGVPVPIGPMQGTDALHSIVQMPKGVPVATVAIGNAWNAGVLAAQILGTGDSKILDRVLGYKAEMREAVLSSK